VISGHSPIAKVKHFSPTSGIEGVSMVNSPRIAHGVLIERVGEELVVVVPGSNEAIRVTGETAVTLTHIQSGAQVDTRSIAMRELLELGVIEVPGFSRRGLIAAGAVGAGAGIAVLAMPGVAAASSDPLDNVDGDGGSQTGGTGDETSGNGGNTVQADFRVSGTWRESGKTLEAWKRDYLLVYLVDSDGTGFPDNDPPETAVAQGSEPTAFTINLGDMDDRRFNFQPENVIRYEEAEIDPTDPVWNLLEVANPPQIVILFDWNGKSVLATLTYAGDG